MYVDFLNFFYNTQDFLLNIKTLAPSSKHQIPLILYFLNE